MNIIDITCDACSAARAATRVTFANGHDLLFCGHCFRKHTSSITSTVSVENLDTSTAPVPVG